MQDRGRQFADVGKHGGDDHPAGFEIGEIEHVVDKLEQRLSAGGDRRQRFEPFLFVHDAADEQFGKTDDGVERRADVVADGGEEEALGFFRGDLLVQCGMEIVVVELAFQSRLQDFAAADEEVFLVFAETSVLRIGDAEVAPAFSPDFERHHDDVFAWRDIDAGRPFRIGVPDHQLAASFEFADAFVLQPVKER